MKRPASPSTSWSVVIAVISNGFSYLFQQWVCLFPQATLRQITLQN